jgi:glutathione synthase/RimK-type ligase-like ATP-grasp enzyme
VKALIVVENPKHWPVAVQGAEVVPAREYLTEPRYRDMRRAAVFNVCRSYSYQTVGYYVSLLAAARGHRTLPSVATLQGMSHSSLVRLADEELDERIQRDLARLKSDEFDLSIYFGKNVASRYDRLSRALFDRFPAPLLRARFVRDDDRWRLRSVRPIAALEIPEAHRPFVVEQAAEYFRKPRRRSSSRTYRYDLAILWREDDPYAPSDERAIRRFTKAAARRDIECWVIEPDEIGRIAEYDALWIRETTLVNHYTYRLARRARAEGLVVLDDPEAIIRCGNKVYQAEVFGRCGIPCPKTIVVHPGSEDEVERSIGFPCVVKKADSSFSLGVARADTREELNAALAELFRESELGVVQAWTPSEFDWRVGVLDRRPLFVARYHMAAGHWQIARRDRSGRTRYGKTEAVALAEAPADVVELGVRAASLFGDGLFGVDLKVVDGRPVVMEVNDNPNLEAGYEDAAEPDVYDRLADYFRTRLDQRGESSRPSPASGTDAR